jgi:predicted amidohydrolase YtcJ
MAARLTTYVVVGIVAATLIAGLIVGAQRDDSDGPVDLIVYNAKVYTADGSGSMAEAVAVRGNQILRVGTTREITRLRRPQTTLVDARGGAVLPGFNDSSVRFIDGGLSLDAVDLAGADTLEEISARIAAWAESNPDRPWIVGRGWTPAAFSASGPTHEALDAAVKDRPAYLVSADGRAAWLNSKAMRLARIARRTPAPDGGVIVKDARRGEPTGVLRDAAMALASRLVPRPTRDERAEALRAAIQEAHRHGITSVHDIAGRAEDFLLYDAAQSAGDLKVRVYAPVDIDGVPQDEAFTQLEGMSSRYPDDPLFKFGGARITIDGPVETERAALLLPYETNAGGNGPDDVDVDALNKFVRLLDTRGWQVTVGASGDRAVHMALDALEHAVRSNPKPQRARRNRVDGVELVDAADVPRFGRLDVVASLTPATPTARLMDSWSQLAGAERASRAWPAGSLASARAKIALSTGWPSAPLDPMTAIHAAVARTTAEGLPEGGWSPAERITLKRAVDAFTRIPAHASFDEQRKGSLKKGMLADIVVLSTDIFDASEPELARTMVAVTIFDGKIVYRRDARATD